MKPLVLLVLPLFYFLISCGQVQRPHPQATTIQKRAVADTSPIRRAYFQNRLKVNPRLAEQLKIARGTIDTVPSLEPYLKEKASCDFERSVDSEGCILVKYTDGFMKKICDGRVTEVITKDGKKYVSRYKVMKNEVPMLPPPPNPSASDPIYKWITTLSEDLLTDVKLLMSNDNKLVSEYMTRENAKCSNSIYRKIEYRMTFIENFYETQ